MTPLAVSELIVILPEPSVVTSTSSEIIPRSDKSISSVLIVVLELDHRVFLSQKSDSEKIFENINKYIPKDVKISKTSTIYWRVSLCVGHTTCFSSLRASLKKFIIIKKQIKNAAVFCNICQQEYKVFYKMSKIF